MGYVQTITENTNSVIVLPDYTLSLSKPYPAALEDCHLALMWMKEHSMELGINQDQLFVAGESAGGGLTAALSLYARDKKEVKIAFWMPLYPMIDCRMQTESMKDNDAPVWDEKANKLGWQLYLGSLYGRDDIPYYASPALAADYRGLPPTYTFVGTIEPFYDETKMYIENLQKADVEAKADEYDGCFHAFDLFGSKKPIGKLATQNWLKAFKYAAEHDFAKQEND